MKFLALTTVFCGLSMAAPLTDAVVARAVTSVKPSSTVRASSAGSSGALIGINVGGSSSPLVGVRISSSTIVAINVGTFVTTSSVTIKPTSMAASSVKVASSTITVAPTSTSANPTALPSTFSAPVQGQGKLTLDNLPAMPAVIDKSFSGVLGSVYGLMSGVCNSDYKCSITVAGTIQSLLVDGNSYTTSSTLSAWCDAGRCYASGNPTVNATAPFTVTCNGNNACSATISGAARAIFTNGQQVELWGWLTPAGYCQGGVCTASIKAFGDPMY